MKSNLPTLYYILTGANLGLAIVNIIRCIYDLRLITFICALITVNASIMMVSNIIYHDYKKG